jgi:predicted nucleotide-binding protein
MPSRSRGPSEPPEPKRFTLQEIETGIRKLQRRIDEVQALDPKAIKYDDARVDEATRNIHGDLIDIFGRGSTEYLRHGNHSVGWPSMVLGKHAAELQRDFAENLPQTVSMLEGLIRRLQEKREDLGAAAPGPPVHAVPLSRRVFVVHGHDEAVKQAVARTLEKLGLKPIILHELADRGRTVIEKLEAETDVAFAVVLMTADDFGGPKSAPRDSCRARARQNVLVELGLFLGKLGRAHVSVLFEPGVEMPSDYSGVLYTELDAGGAWQFKLAKEINAAGIPVNLNKLL